ncbi:fumarylacetoacetate hydrolase family protein [Falsiroseomonas tokyonensis]|uniref:Fumarylacetoacetate hydrolase family protein n=1 Tax=Falsiroseomonas tokyonensis TaxID=430521 RepID=A0ABV7C070_9PROT|nr:fumarylacetoacetate hydrolase family protein [Falsiroseomonas tokyonensis]MBU8541199.1 fumarylacetoacetate hydrolase family protein [Falsiroseomonas tokyonensis]
MRLLTFEDAGKPRLGLRLGADVVALDGLGGDVPADMPALLAKGADYLASLAARAKDAPRRPLAGLTLLPPVPVPGKMICIGLNYALHAKEGGNPIPDYPAVFMRGATSLVAHDQPMLRPRASQKLDWEAELAIVIGRRARHVREADALSVIAGYACFNEGSVRDFQRKSTQWTVGKNFDRTGAFGPEIVTADEVSPGADNLRIMTRLNGEVMQDSTTGDMIFKVPKLIAILSEVMTLEPGDVIATGTPSGVGYARKPPRFLAPGDVVEVEIESLGVLRNTIEDEA